LTILGDFDHFGRFWPFRAILTIFGNYIWHLFGDFYHFEAKIGDLNENQSYD
jgi:hypothetical protein